MQVNCTFALLQEFSNLLSPSQNTEAFFLHDFCHFPIIFHLSLASPRHRCSFFLLLFEPENTLKISFSDILVNCVFKPTDLAVAASSQEDGVKDPRGLLALQVDDHLKD